MDGSKHRSGLISAIAGPPTATGSNQGPTFLSSREASRTFRLLRTSTVRFTWVHNPRLWLLTETAHALSDAACSPKCIPDLCRSVVGSRPDPRAVGGAAPAPPAGGAKPSPPADDFWADPARSHDAL